MNLIALGLLAAAAATSSASETPAAAGSISGKVSITALSVGSQVEGPQEAFVFLEEAVGEPAGTGPFELVQKDKQFDPRLLVVPVGATVSFPNHDALLHNVYSGSETKKFHLGLFGEGESRDVVFDKPGIVAVYCNVHPQMIATILVVPGAAAAHPAKNGAFRFDAIPPGTYHLLTFFPHGFSRRDEVVVHAGAATRFDPALREVALPGKHDREDGTRYGNY